MPLTIPYTELPPVKPGETFETEWETYRAKVGQWLADGLEGKHVLIKGSNVLGFWDSQEEALAAGYEKFLTQPFLIHHVLRQEPLLRVGAYFRWLK
jgi:hypothetical protein